MMSAPTPIDPNDESADGYCGAPASAHEFLRGKAGVMTREEHLAWCKARANEYLDRGDIQNGVTSMLSDLSKHPETEVSSQGALAMLGMQTIMSGDLQAAKRFVNGFN